MGAFDHEGAFLCSNMSVLDEFPNARALRTSQERECGCHASGS